MSRFLFTTMPATGHVMPKLPIARELVARGHEVHWYTGAVYRDRVEDAGATHHPIQSAEDFGGQGIAEAFPELVGLTGIAMVRQAFRRVFIDNAEGMLRDCQAILDEHPADAILSEPLFVAARWLHELGGAPWATLADQPVLVIATTGGPASAAFKALGYPVPANARIEQFVPYAELMPHVDALVTNGGYGTTQHALSCGVPIVVAGATEDKPEVAARIAWSGAGIRIREQSPSTERVAEAVHSVLSTSRYRDRAQAIAAEMRGYDAPRSAANLLERLAGSQRPAVAASAGHRRIGVTR